MRAAARRARPGTGPGRSATTVKRIASCRSPQNHAHTPSCVPAAKVRLNRSRVVGPDLALEPLVGTQKSCRTSSDRARERDGAPGGHDEAAVARHAGARVEEPPAPLGRHDVDAQAGPRRGRVDLGLVVEHRDDERGGDRDEQRDVAGLEPGRLGPAGRLVRAPSRRRPSTRAATVASTTSANTTRPTGAYSPARAS